MAPSAALFRLLLVLALISQGVGSAFAGVSMELRHAHADVPAVASQTHADVHADMPECDDGRQRAELTTIAGDPAASDEGAVPCCEGKACDGACSQYASAAVAVSRAASAAIATGSALRSLAADHAAPVQPSLIRPPIG